MATIDAERNVLFGAIAVQTGLINRTSLTSAYRVRAEDEQKDLGQILVDHGALDAESKILIEALASKHLSVHGGRLERSLAAMNATGSARESLTATGDSKRTTTLLQGGSDSTVDGTDQATFSVGAALADGRRFRVLRPHAQGGLGAVFVAFDTELNREVALKQILDRHADNPTSQSRFLLEAEITGGLEHPGIVPVYGKGAYENGRPYYAMRFIRGNSFKEAIDQFHEHATTQSPSPVVGESGGAGHGDHGRRGSQAMADSQDLDLRKLLRRFLDVCNAIDYAHSRGVLHRDIKPSNIILGKHGETLVVDWGLAKATGKGDESAGERTMTPIFASGSAETLPGSAMGTPAYMSPEQARGEIDQLGPRSDVYSLGATLYCLLTGKPPFQSEDLHSLLLAVRRGEFPPPRQLDPKIDRTLEAVCLKAMALAPELRYASARALADDVERWMADDPVTALEEGWARRLARWSRRHRSTTRAAAAALVVVATVATLAALAIGREQAQTRDALQAERLARQSESKARGLAQEQSQLALDAIREYNTGVSREFLLKQPEMEKLRESLLQAPIRFYRRLAQNIEANGIADPAARARLGQAQLDLGETINQIGAVADSITNLEQARDNIEQVVRELPGVPEYRLLLAKARYYLASRYDKANRPDQARGLFDSALADFEHLAQANPQDRKYRANQAEALQLRADFLWDHGELDAARRDYLASTTVAAALHAEDPNDLDVLDKLGSSLNNLSILFAEAGQSAERMRTLTDSTALRERLVAATPADDPRRELFLSSLGSCYGNLGDASMHDGALDQAVTWTKKALAIQDEQVKRRPNSVECLERVGASHIILGQIELKIHDLATARAALEGARPHLERLKHVRPSEVIYRMHLANCLGLLAEVEIESEATAPALNLTRRSTAEYEEVLRINPNYHPAAHAVARLLLQEAAITWDIGESGRALAIVDRAAAMLRQLVASYPEVTRYRSELAGAIRAHVRMSLELGRDDGAEARLGEALSVAESVVRDDPDQVANLANAAALDSDLGSVLGRRGQMAEAQSLFGRALKRLDQARSRSPKDEQIRGILAQTVASRAEFLGRQAKFGEALAELGSGACARRGR